ncbi:hypothetical protein [Dactylosporangium sp. NPDC051484]|uniref:hypothetical protein n=1 Tax=Dactylosporangium sp. NPDC051484 TaxID=3154942 RepID=UPI00344FF29B
MHFDPGTLEGSRAAWFSRWQGRARQAADALRDATARGDGEPPNWRQSVWAGLKAWLLEHVFHGKCAYCEGRMLAQSYGAAEHYRPKSRVMTPAGREPGYAWLAYDWRNIVPACDQCNSGEGKQDQFPIAGRRVLAPAELADPDDMAELDAVEQPLLLHPYSDDPEQHLLFGLAGAVGPRDGSTKGRQTIAVCRLDRAALMDDRARIQEQVRTDVALAFLRAGNGDATLEAALERVHEKHAGAQAEYSAAGRQALLDVLDVLVDSGARFRDAVRR